MAEHPYRPMPREQSSTWVHLTPTLQVSGRFIDKIRPGRVTLTDGSSYAVSGQAERAAFAAKAAVRRG